jgi:hypothetical protein
LAIVYVRLRDDRGDGRLAGDESFGLPRSWLLTENIAAFSDCL